MIMDGLHVFAQDRYESGSFGDTYIHHSGETVIFGFHNFNKGSGGVKPGMVGTDRDSIKGLLSFSSTAMGWRGATPEKYVDGYVKRYGNRAFTFPIGDNGRYNPAAVSGGADVIAGYFAADPSIAITSDLFAGNFGVLPQGGPFNRSSKDQSVVNISDNEYWDIDGNEEARITLSWNGFSDIDRLCEGDLSRLIIVGWNGSQWVPIPSKVDILYLNRDSGYPFFNGGVSNKTQGSISTLDKLVPSDYVVYTLGSKATAVVGDFVWEDMNRNGIQEPGEPGIEGVTIKLYTQTNELVQTKITDQFGKYLFVEVLPGSYYIKFEAPTNFSITLPGQGSFLTNSDVGFNKLTNVFNINANETNLNIDAGFYKTGSIGDYVWIDTNQDGIQQDSEPGFANVRVELLNSEKTILASTLTNNSGFYQFTNLPPVKYFIKFVNPNGFQFTSYHATFNIDKDSDANPFSGMSDTIVLLSGQILDHIDAGLSTSCLYFVELEKEQTSCAGKDGMLHAIVQGATGPYKFKWNTGDTSEMIFNLNPGAYSVTVTDAMSCIQVATHELSSKSDCPKICAEINTSVFLEGPFNYDKMNMETKLNQLGYLPGQRPITFFGKYTAPGQPFENTPWNYQGPEGMIFQSASVTENNKHYPVNAVDWVLVSLREKIDKEYEVCEKAGILLADGTIEFIGDECCLVDPNKVYYVVIEHRNHLIVMSPTALSITDKKVNFDFRTNQSYRKLLGYGQKKISNNVFVMYSGNGDQYVSGESPVDINVNDLSEWLKENGKHSSYYKMDFDLNGDVNVQDKGIYLRNIGIFTDVPKKR